MLDELQPIEKALREGHPELARNLLRILIEDYPDNADVWYWAAQAAINDAQRKAFLEKAVDLDPLHHKAGNALHALLQGEPLTLPQEPKPISAPVSTPQADVTPKIHYAKFWRRALATIVDLLITVYLPLMVALSLIAIFMPDAMPQMSNVQEGQATDVRAIAIFFGLSFVVRMIYFGFFLSQNKGQTVGKMLMKVRVIKQDGTTITIWEAILRNVIGYELFQVSAGVSFFWGMLDANRKTWHDYIVDTIVVDAV